MAAHIPQSHGDENHCRQVSEIRKKQLKKTKERQKSRMDESIIPLIVAVLLLALVFFQPMCFFSRFTSKLFFYFETGNTKLPETAQFTQAPQSTTAFKLS